jgi:hypothetical protein
MYYNGGLLAVRIEWIDDHTASIKIGEDKLMDIEIKPDREIAVHKRKREKPIAFNAREFFEALRELLAG